MMMTTRGGSSDAMNYSFGVCVVGDVVVVFYKLSSLIFIVTSDNKERKAIAE